MKILTIDTSDASTLGVVDAPGVRDFDDAAARQADGAPLPGLREIAVRTDADGRRHAETLTPFVRELVAEAGIEKPDAIVAGTGPAPFTGLRAGLVTARVLAYAWDVPLVGVSSLEVMASAALEGADDASVIAALDARRHEIYALVSMPEDRHATPEIVDHTEFPAFREAHGVARVVVPREGLYPELAGADVVPVTPLAMAALALRHVAEARAGRPIDLGTEPQYLRRPDVQVTVSQPSQPRA